MNKKIYTKKYWAAIGIVLIFLCLSCAYREIGKNELIFRAESEKSVIVTPTISSKINFDDLFQYEKQGYGFVTTVGNTKISFGPPLQDELHRTRNAGWKVYVNEEKIGEIGGQGVAPFGLLQDRYFIVRVRSTLGAIDLDFELYSIDLIDKVIKQIDLPKIDYFVEQKEFKDKFPFVYKIKDGNGFNFVSYMVGTKFNENEEVPSYFRVSPKDVWKYDPITNSYSFVERLAE